MDEGRKKIIGIMAAILSAMHMQRADDLFGMPNGTALESFALSVPSASDEVSSRNGM